MIKNLLVIISLMGHPIFVSAADNTKQIMNELSTDLAIAETNLRIVLARPANSKKWPKEFKSYESCEMKLSAALRLLAFEQRHPGYLEGLHGDADWNQYKGVRELYESLKGTSDAFIQNRQTKKTNPAEAVR
jgi:hypothetical protein